MNTRSCIQAVKTATGDVFTDREIDDLMDSLVRKAKRARREAPTIEDQAAIRQAAGELTREQIFGALQRKRAEAFAELAKGPRQGRLDALPGNESQKLSTILVGSERQGIGTGRSVDAEGRAETMSAWGEIELGLNEMKGLKDRISNFWGFAERGIDRKIAAEIARLNGDTTIAPSGDDGVIHAARIFKAAIDRAREVQNQAGAWISPLTGYIARQAHDRLKVAGGFWRELGQVGERVRRQGAKGFDWEAARQQASARAFKTWHDFIRPRLHDATFEGVEAGDVTFNDVMKAEDEKEGDALLQKARQRQKNLADAKALHAAGVIKDPTDARELFLYKVWSDIVTGRHQEISGQDDAAEYRPPSSKARDVSKSRVLHFKSPDAWMDYAAKYGRGSIYQTIVGQVERAERNAALMRTWGPNPDAAYQNEVARLSEQARLRGDVDIARKLYSARQTADWEALNGRLNTPENLRLAMILRGLRAWEGMTKLGGIVLSKATDLPMTGHAFARVGAGFLSGYDGAFRGILRLQSDEAKHAAEILHVGARSFAGHIGGQFNGDGWGTWGSRLMYRLNLFDFVNEGVRKGAAEMISRHLGEESLKDWSGLHQGTRETFERFGIDEHAWELARKGVTKADDGNRYFTTEHFDQIGSHDLLRWAGVEGKATDLETVERAHRDLGMRFRTMIHNVIDDTTSEPRLREQAAMSFGTRAGTPMGEAARAFWQFKGFVQTILGRHLAPAMRGYAGYQPVALMAHFLIASTLAGYLSMNAKMIAAGQVPRSPIGKDVGETTKIWLASLAQGGGLGIYGDFLFGEANRNGMDWGLTALAGPLIGDLEAAGKIVYQAVHGGDVSPTTGRSPLPGELVHLASRNAPLVNLFYTRLVLDYLVWWRLAEAASPGYLDRYQSRVENDEGRQFLVPPTAAR